MAFLPTQSAARMSPPGSDGVAQQCKARASNHFDCRLMLHFRIPSEGVDNVPYTSSAASSAGAKYVTITVRYLIQLRCGSQRCLTRGAGTEAPVPSVCIHRQQPQHERQAQGCFKALWPRQPPHSRSSRPASERWASDQATQEQQRHSLDFSSRHRWSVSTSASPATR